MDDCLIKMFLIPVNHKLQEDAITRKAIDELMNVLKKFEHPFDETEMFTVISKFLQKISFYKTKQQSMLFLCV